MGKDMSSPHEKRVAKMVNVFKKYRAEYQ